MHRFLICNWSNLTALKAVRIMLPFSWLAPVVVTDCSIDPIRLRRAWWHFMYLIFWVKYLWSSFLKLRLKKKKSKLQVTFARLFYYDNLLIIWIKSLFYSLWFYTLQRLIWFFSCAGSLLLCTGFLYLQWAGSTLPCSGRTSHCGDLLRNWGSRHMGFSSCQPWAQLSEASGIFLDHVPRTGRQILYLWTTASLTM